MYGYRHISVVLLLFIFNFFGLMMPTQVVNTYIFIKIRKTKCLSVFDAAIG